MNAPLRNDPRDTYMPPDHGWTCFHCGETFPPDFAGQRAAGEHFGVGYIDSIPGCRLRMRKGEVSLLRRIRWLERQLREVMGQMACESTDADQAMASMRSEHAQALIREEEKGFRRGLDAAKRYPETIGLRRAS